MVAGPQVITAAEFHPSHCSVFAFSSSKGCIRVADMRAAALCDNHAKAFEATEPQAGPVSHNLTPRHLEPKTCTRS